MNDEVIASNEADARAAEAVEQHHAEMLGALTLAVEGLKTLAPVHHALIVAVHAWTHGPMARAGDLVDLTLMAWDTERAELLALARRWGLERVLRTTLGSADAVLFGGRRPRSMRFWARNLQIKAAVEELYKKEGVTVLAVNVLTTKAKEKRRGTRRGRIVGHTTPWRKAIVTLAPGQKIEFFEGV